MIFALSRSNSLDSFNSLGDDSPTSFTSPTDTLDPALFPRSWLDLRCLVHSWPSCVSINESRSFDCKATGLCNKLWGGLVLVCSESDLEGKYSFCSIFRDLQYKVVAASRPSILKISTKIHQTFSHFLWIFCKNQLFFNCFHRIFQRFWSNFIGISPRIPENISNC